MATAYEMRAKWPSSELVVVPDAGHSCTEPGIISELVNATDKMAKIIQEKPLGSIFS
jgi:proline iminopeptidase